MKNVALITGASSGIGKELAYIHAEQGGDLVLIARREGQLLAIKSDLENKFKIQVLVIVIDLTLPTAPQEIFNLTKEKNIEVNYLINNAGFGGRGKFHERELKTELSMIQLNIIALTALTHLFLPEFVKQGRGKILNVSSTASLLPGPLQAVYFATKAYVTSFSNAIAEELEGTNITVTALLPGATETEFAQTANMKQSRLFNKTASAREVAEDGYRAMLAGKLNVISGVSFFQNILLKLVPLSPKKFVLKQTKFMQKDMRV